MALVKRQNKETGGTASRARIVKVDPYENAENVMKLMAEICAAKSSMEVDDFLQILTEVYRKEVDGVSLEQYLRDNRHNLQNRDFDRDLWTLCSNLLWSLSQNQNTEHTQVVVAGGFSSGKSSFLNRLTSSVNLLPTGVEPVSVVKTYLYCSSGYKEVSVRGVNQRNVMVELSPGVLQAIQHAKQSNIYLASVLDKLFVEIPVQDLDGVVFIDTPGYNNSDKANSSNGKTDRDTALEAMKEGNVLFWLIDCERGTTVTADIEIIKQFAGKKVFIFNKADKKGHSEAEVIVRQAAITLEKEFEKEDIIDILAFSTLDNEVYYSMNGLTFTEILEQVKRLGNGKTGQNKLIADIKGLFETEIQACYVRIKRMEEEYQSKVYEKKETYEMFREQKEVSKNLIEDLQVLADNKAVIDDWMRFCEGVFNSFKRVIDELYCDCIYLWDKTRIDNASRVYSSHFDSYEEMKAQCTNDGMTGEEVVAKVEKRLNYLERCNKEQCDEKERESKELLVQKDQMLRMIKVLENYRDDFMDKLDRGIKLYSRSNKPMNCSGSEVGAFCVFEAIKNDDYKAFLRSFETGVNLAMFNTEGYTPLTYAVFHGNNEMVKFMLQHGADASAKDKNGYNALHTAVENQYRDICELLLAEDPDLLETETDQGESVADLAGKQTFTDWIENKIHNKY